jgi:hypothetical protein
MRDTTLLTPENRPDHAIIGQIFKGHGFFYYCDSYDPAQGFWMTPLYDQYDAVLKRPVPRTNVSERAIGRTFHDVWIMRCPDGEPIAGCQHTLTREQREMVLDEPRLQAMIAEARSKIEVEA